MRFYGLSKEELGHLRDGMSILGRVMDVEEFGPYLYAMVTSGETLEAARNIIQGDRPQQVAVAIALSTDTLYFLMGSGVYLETEEFAYLGGEGEGSRVAELNQRCKLFMNELGPLAVAGDSTFLGEFLDSQAPQQAQAPKIERTAPTAPTQAQEPQPQQPPKAPVASEAKTAAVPGFDRILIGDEPLQGLKVTQLIEIGDHLISHQKGRGKYLLSEHEGREWMIYTEEPDLAVQNLERIIKNKYDLPEAPEVMVLSPKETEDVMDDILGDYLKEDHTK